MKKALTITLAFILIMAATSVLAEKPTEKSNNKKIKVYEEPNTTTHQTIEYLVDQLRFSNPGINSTLFPYEPNMTAMP